MLRDRRFALPGFCVLAALSLSACMSRTIDLARVLQVTDVSTGYFDVGIVQGSKNKIVPTISVRLKNNDTLPMDSVQMLAKFQVIGDPQELGSAYVRAIGPEGLAPGQTANPIVMKSELGYTGEQPRALMFSHTDFKDVRVELFAKYRAQTWAKLGEYKIARQLLTR
jgi:hypothetical protein